MTDIALGVASFPALLLLIFLRVPIGLAMFLVGMAGYYYLTGGMKLTYSVLKSHTYSEFSSYSLSIVPMFLLMGHFATLGGMSTALFKAAEAFLGHRRGGVAMSAVGACAGFGAICGSSLATASTMGQVALPELRERGYSGALATGTLAAGGVLGILIPPSVVLVIYAVIVEANIVTMFAAAFLPGILAVILFLVTIAIYAAVRPAAAPKGDPATAAELRSASIKVLPVLIIFGIVIGGI